jgi:hypothetical protein
VEIVSSEQWLSVETHFDALIGLTEDERISGLAEIGDEVVRLEVAALLGHTSQDSAILDVVKSMAVTAHSMGRGRRRGGR